MDDDSVNPVNSSVQFNLNFWGEKFNGWETLYRNFRSSLNAVKEFEQYLRECASTEDAYVRNLDKIKFQIQKFSGDSSLAPIWHNILKELNYTNSAAHLHFKYRIEELIKETQNYYDDLRKKKQKIKETELKTQQLIELIRNLALNLTKTKEAYYQSYLEVEKQLNENSLCQTPNLASQLTLQKIEKKTQIVKDDYLTSIDKYNSTRIEFEQKFNDSCNLFQLEEELHLKRMRQFIMNYTQLVAQLNSSRQKNFNDCQQKLNNVYTNDMLLQQLVLSKRTGQDKPAEALFIEPNFDQLDTSNRSSFSSQIPRSPTTFEPDSPEPMDSPINFSSSAPTPTTPKLANKLSPNRTVELRKRNDGRGFNLLDIFSRANKGKSDYNTMTPKKSKLNESLSKSSLSSSYSFLPSFLLSSNREDNNKPSDSEASTLTNQNVYDAVTDVFDKQLKQIDTLEQEMSTKNRILSTGPVDITTDSSQRKKVSRIVDKTRISFDNESPVDFGRSISPISNLKRREEKPSAGSLITATSLDDHKYFENSSFERLSDYADSFETNTINSSKSFFDKMNDLDPGSKKKPSHLFAYPEQSDDENKLSSSFKETFIDSISTNDDNAIVNTEDIEDDDDNSNESDDDSDDSDAPKRVFLRIKPLSEVDTAASPEVLRQISKNLQLRPQSYVIAKQKTANKRNTMFQTNGNESLTSISSINNILPSSSPSLSSDRDGSRSQSTISVQNNLNQIDENNNNLNTNIFQMDKTTNLEVEKINTAPPLPPLTLTIKQKYHEIITKPQFSQSIMKLKSDSDSMENLNYDCLSDLSMNNSPNYVREIQDENFAKF